MSDDLHKKATENVLFKLFGFQHDRKARLVTFFFVLFVCMYQSGAHPVSSDESTVKEKTLSVLLYHCTVLNTSYKNLLHTSRLQEARPALSLVVGCLCDYTDR